MKTKKLHKILDEIKSIFLNGFFTLIPITVTLLLFKTTFKIVSGWIHPLHKIQPACLQNIPYSEFILVILFIFLTGIILKFFILKRFIHFIEESIFAKIPLLRSLYSGIKRLVNALTQKDQSSFQKVVLVEFPNSGTYSVGFLTGEVPQYLAPTKDKIYYNIFVPHTPNPTSGFFVLVEKDRFRETDLSRQEAMALIISGGIIKPDRFNK